MDAVRVIAVMGACRPERRGYAEGLAGLTSSALIPASRLIGSPDPLREALALASWADSAEGVVVELPDDVQATEVIGAFADAEGRTRLRGVVCVVDAAHLIDDLHRDDHLTLPDTGTGSAGPAASRAELAVAQIEYASTIVLANWATLPTAELAVAMALLNHLSPRGRLRLHGIAGERCDDEEYGLEQDRAGWVCLLNGAFDPHMTDARVSALRYEQVRPLHPGRLKRLLDDRIESGEFGRVVRSAGFCRLATRPNVVAAWEQVGPVISLEPLAVDEDLDTDDELLALGQDLAILGLDLDHARLVAALDQAALTDAELAAGPEAWVRFADPFPIWATAPERRE